MKIIVNSIEEKKCIEVLMKNLQYAWELNGKDCDAFYKAFEYVNDNPENWKNDKLIKDYTPTLEDILKNIKKTKVELG